MHYQRRAGSDPTFGSLVFLALIAHEPDRPTGEMQHRKPRIIFSRRRFVRRNPVALYLHRTAVLERNILANAALSDADRHEHVASVVTPTVQGMHLIDPDMLMFGTVMAVAIGKDARDVRTNVANLTAARAVRVAQAHVVVMSGHAFLHVSGPFCAALTVPRGDIPGKSSCLTLPAVFRRDV